MFKKSTCFASLVVFVVMLMIVPASAKTVNLKIIETSDVHGAYFPYDFIKAKEVPTSLAQVYAYVKEQRANPDQHVILLDNGDVLQGQPTVYYYNFEKTDGTHICADMMNFMQYDAGGFGNHDVEPGHEVYDKFVKDINHPWLAANAVKTGTEEPYLEAYAVFEKDGVKIAVLGMTTPGVESFLPERFWEGIDYQDMVETGQKWIKMIQEKENPDIMVGLFHEDEKNITPVLQQLSGLDVAFIGHDHEGWNKMVPDSAGKEVLLLGSKDAARSVAVASITLTYDETNKTWNKEFAGEEVDMQGYAADEEFMTKFGDVVDELKAYADKAIGKFTETISTRDAMFGDSAFVDLIHKIQLDLTKADVSFAAPLLFDTTINEGEVFVRDAFNLYVYENLLYTMKMTGKEIKGFLEYSYDGWFNQMAGPDDHLIALQKDENGNLVWSNRYNSYGTKTRYYNYDSAAGIIYTVDVSKPAGERITIKSMADGTPFEMDKMYVVALNSYRGSGGGGHLETGAGIPKAEFGNRMLSSTIQDLRFFLMKWIEEQQVVTPAALGNWDVVPADWWVKAKETDYKLLYESEAPQE